MWVDAGNPERNDQRLFSSEREFAKNCIASFKVPKGSARLSPARPLKDGHRVELRWSVPCARATTQPLYRKDRFQKSRAVAENIHLQRCGRDQQVGDDVRFLKVWILVFFCGAIMSENRQPTQAAVGKMFPDCGFRAKGNGIPG